MLHVWWPFHVKCNVPSIINKNTSTSYLLESSNLWHSRLRHVNYGSLRRLINMECLPKFNIDSNYKCGIYVEAKLTNAPFHLIEKSTI
mgnify:CR=1 FL=1